MNTWQPIDTAPTDNKRPLYLAHFNPDGVLKGVDFNGTYEYWEESWEMPHINGYAWFSYNDMEEPTHWAYQDEPLPPENFPKKLNHPPGQADILSTVYVDGWNDCCEAYFGGLPVQEPMVVTIETIDVNFAKQLLSYIEQGDPRNRFSTIDNIDAIDIIAKLKKIVDTGEIKE